jgi:trimeric autotransporter adhesin
VDTDATNLSQLKALGATIGTSGVVTNSFVAYDSTAKDKVTLGGGSNGTTLSNVAAGKATTDAVNVGQLTAAGLSFNTTGGVTNSFVAYDNASKNAVTLGGGAAGTQIHNLAAGMADTDATNVSQLKALGATIGTSGTVTNSFVAYDAGTKASITLANGSAGTQIHNVAAGTADADAVNVKQLNTAMSDTATVSSSLKYVRFGASSAATAQASGTDSMALGGNSFANQQGAVAIGSASLADVANTVSVGSSFTQRRITNVAAGTGDTDAVNLGQVESLLSGYQTKGVQAVRNTQLLGASLLGATASLTPDQMIKSGPSDKGSSIEALGTDSIAIGLNTHANGNNSVAIGTNINSTGDGSVAMGNATIANGAGASAIGVNSSVIADRALAVGNGAAGETVDSIAIGTKTMVGGAGDTGVAIGANSTVSGAGSILLGNSSTSSGAGNIVLGSNIKATGTNSVVLGAGSDGSLSNVVSVGKSGAERRIVNVAAGTANTDAVNLGQMTSAIAAAGGGGGGSTLITQATPTADVLVGGTTGGTHVSFAGTGGAARTDGRGERSVGELRSNGRSVDAGSHGAGRWRKHRPDDRQGDGPDVQRARRNAKHRGWRADVAGYGLDQPQEPDQFRWDRPGYAGCVDA